MAKTQSAIEQIMSGGKTEKQAKSLLDYLGLPKNASTAQFETAAKEHGQNYTSPKVGGGSGVVGDIANAVQQDVYSPIGQALTHPVEAMTAGFSGHEPHSAAPAEPKPKAKKKADTALPTPEQATTSPFTEIAQQLAQEYLGQVQQLQSLTSGAETPGLEAEAQGAAQSDLKGLTAGLPASVQGAMQGLVGSTPAVPLAGEVSAAQQKLGNAQAAGGLGMAGAIGAMGPAEAETLGAAPYSTLLNELISESAYRASSPSYGPSALGLNTANTPSWLQTVLGNIGLPLSKPNASSALSTPTLTTPSKAAKGGTSGTVPISTGTTGGP